MICRRARADPRGVVSYNDLDAPPDVDWSLSGMCCGHVTCHVQLLVESAKKLCTLHCLWRLFAFATMSCINITGSEYWWKIQLLYIVIYTILLWLWNSVHWHLCNKKTFTCALRNDFVILVKSDGPSGRQSNSTVYFVTLVTWQLDICHHFCHFYRRYSPKYDIRIDLEWSDS